MTRRGKPLWPALATGALLLAPSSQAQSLLTWTQAPGTALDIGVQPSTVEPSPIAETESVWIIQPDQKIAGWVPSDGVPWRTNANAFGTGTRISVDSNKTPWATRSTGLWRWNFGPFTFEQQFSYTEAPLDVAVGANAAIWAVVNEGPITVLQSRVPGATAFTRNATFCLPRNCGKIDHVAVSPQGEPWILVNSDIYRGGASGTNWTRVAGTLSDISFGGDGSLWGAAGDGRLYYWDTAASTWVAEGATGVRSVSARNASEVWVVRSDNTIWRGVSTNMQSLTDYMGVLNSITAKLGQMTDAHTAMTYAPDLAPLVTTYRAIRPKVQALVGSGGGFQSNQAALQAAENALNDKVGQMLAGTLAPTVSYYLKGLK